MPDLTETSGIIRRFSRYALYPSVGACLVLVVFLGQQVGSHGLNRTFVGSNGYTRIDQWPWPYVDGADFETTDRTVERITFEGVLWQGRPGRAVWRIIHNGDLDVRVNGQTILNVRDSMSRTVNDVSVMWDGDWLALRIDYRVDLSTQPAPVSSRLEFGVYEQDTLGRWQLLPSYRLYPSAPERSSAERDQNLAALVTLALTGLSAAILGQALVRAWQVRLWHRRSFYIAASLAVFTFVLRFVILSDRAASDPLFYWITPGGDDNYALMARQLLVGRYQLAGTLWQPGNILWLAGINVLLGPQLANAYLVNALLGALCAVVVLGAGWLAFGRRAGIVAGLLAALYPPLIFYQATLQTAPLDALLVALALMIGLWTLRSASTLGAALYGLIAGTAALFRATNGLVILAFLLALFVAWRNRNAQNAGRRSVTQGLVAAGFMALMLAPQTLLNASIGVFSPISGNGPITLYGGNNRDTDGNWTNRGMIFDAVARQGRQWSAALLRDIRADPVRAISLVLRKVGLFWSNQELMSNVDYGQSGLAYSPLLRALSLDGRAGMAALALFAWAGVVLLLLDRTLRREPSSTLIISMISTLILGTAVFVIAGRLRVPVLPLLCVTGGFCLDWIAVAISAMRQRRMLALAGAASVALLLGMDLIADNLPPKRFYYGAPPAEIVWRGTDFGGRLRLLGFSDVQAEHQPGGYIYLTLHWEALAKMPEDYAVYVELTDSQKNLIAITRLLLGSVSYPPLGTSHWPRGAKLAESVLLEIPHGDVPPVMDLNIGVYRTQSLERLPLINAQGEATLANFLRLFRFGVTPPAPAKASHSNPVDYVFGETLRLTAYEVLAQASAKDSLSVTVRLEAITPVWEDYALFFHLLDKDGKLVAQSDGPTLAGDWTTSALIPGSPITAIRTLDLPTDLPAGKYRLYMGFYSYATLERLQVKDAAKNTLPDGIVLLATIGVLP